MGNKLSLIGAKQAAGIQRAPLKYEPAHVSRYLITASLIKQIVGSKTNPKILDVGGKKGLLREFGIASTIIDLEESDEEDYIQGDALNMPFEDNSFDTVVSCDVLEHIPAAKREKFIDEIIRVTKGYAVICAPFNQGGVANAEKEANQFYKSIAEGDHRWLIEHIENGLPDKNLVEQYLSKYKLPHQVFSHLSLDVWNMTTRIHFLNAVFGDSADIRVLSEKMYSRYQTDLCELDYSADGYRTFFVINKKDKFSIEFPEEEKQAKAKSQFKEFLDKELIDCLKAMSIERRDNNHEILKLNKDVLEVSRREAEKNIELETFKASRSWKLARKISKTRNFYK